MRTRALLQFRMSRERLAATLPDALGWIARSARDDGPSFSVARVDIEPVVLEELLRWGRARTGDVTRMRIARLTHTWSREELGQGPVELERAVEREPPEVVNLDAAYVGRWSCNCCDRLDLEQVAPLEVTEIDPEVDLQLTATREVLVATGFREVVERAGATTRPLAGNVEVLQLVTPPKVRIAPVFPLEAIDQGCTCCGRRAYDRSDRVEGNLFTDGATGLVVAQEWPLTVEPITFVAGPEVAGQAVEPLGWRGRVSSEPIHAAGDRVEPGQLRLFRSGFRPAFLGLGLRDALAAAGARLPPCRPVRIAAD